jgi:hypothetical protein
LESIFDVEKVKDIGSNESSKEVVIKVSTMLLDIVLKPIIEVFLKKIDLVKCASHPFEVYEEII